jgi:hypothetical protein
VVKDAQGRVGKGFQQPRDLLKNRHFDSLKNSRLTLSQGMLKKGDVDDDADDDEEVRTSASQNHTTPTLSTKEYFEVCPPIAHVCPLTGNRQSRGYLLTVPAGLSAPSRPPCCKTGFTKFIQLLCNWGR